MQNKIIHESQQIHSQVQKSQKLRSCVRRKIFKLGVTNPEKVNT